MFSLNGAVKYKYIPNYQDMRGGYDKLCGVIRSLGEDPEDGTAYVFQSVVESFKVGLLSPVFDV
jgi:hypothetical protein